MSAALLYAMFKEKTEYPLHFAIRMRREDVVFLYLIEFSQMVSSFQKFRFILYIYDPSCEYQSISTTDKMCDASIPSSCWTSVDLGRLCKLRGTKEFTQLVFLFWLQSIILFLVIAAVLDLSVFSLKFDDHVRADRFVVGIVESEFWLETLKWKIPYSNKIFILSERLSTTFDTYRHIYINSQVRI